MFGVMIAFVVVALVVDVLLAALLFHEPRPHAVLSFLLLGAFLAGAPLWHRLAPRPIFGLRAIGWIAGWIGVCVMGPIGDHDLALRAHGLVAFVLYLEIARALLERRDHRSELVPEMRVRRHVARELRGRGRGIDRPPAEWNECC